ncbi:MAG: DUF1152 domain-containing protein [Archangium sp.]
MTKAKKGVDALPSMVEPTLFRHLASCKRILVAGAGGGFDVYAALPIAAALWNRGQTAFLANLSFTHLAIADGKPLVEGLHAVTPQTKGPDDYFPERLLARFLESEGLPSTVYAFERSGVATLTAAYAWLVEKLDLDAIVLVDGGTDILMFGDEDGLGTPVEDMTSLAAVGQLRIAHRHVACIGFGVDAYHGVSHGLVLENIAALDRDGAYHGALSLSQYSAEGALYLRAVDHSQRQQHFASIVNGSIGAAVSGQFGDVQFTQRTSNSELFINPLMSLYFTFDLMGLVQRNQYLRRLVGTPNAAHTALIIEQYRNEVEKVRARRPIPH